MKIEKENNVYNEIPMMHNGDNAKHMGKKILKPIIQEKIVKVPVTQYVEKIIEKEEIKYVNKYVDVIKPIITYKTKHILKPIYLDKIKYETKVLEREKIIHIPKIEYKNRIVEVPVYVHREKLIEKKVPLVIERVIPVLNIRTSEKNVLADTIATPGICIISDKDKMDKHLKCVTEQHKENSNEIPHNKMSFASSMRSNDVDVTNMQTYVSNQESIREQVGENVTNNMQGNKIESDDCSSKDSAHGDNESNIGRSAPLKHNTQYEGESNENIHEEDHAEEPKEETNYISNVEDHFTENRQEYVINGEHQDSNAGINSEYNTTRFNIDISEHVHVTEDEGFEKFNGNHSHYEVSTNNLMDMNMNNNAMFNENGQLYTVKNENENRAFSEQHYISEPTQAEPKVYSFPFHGSYHNKYQEVKHEQHEVEPNYANISMLHVPKEQYASVHTIHNERIIQTPSKPMFMPSYANGNGQAILSVRPATIVEYKPKARKHRASLCNFLNNCCRGNQE